MNQLASARSNKKQGTSHANGHKLERALSTANSDARTGVMALQHTAGNRAVSMLLQPPGAGPPPVQAKLLIGAPHDRYEQEADRIAGQLTRGRTSGDASSPGLQHQPGQERPDSRPQGLARGLSTHRPQMLRRQPLDEDEQITIEEAPSIEDDESQVDLTEAQIPEAEGRDEEEFLQAKRESGAIAEVPSGLLTRIQALRGRGQPLASPQRDVLESHFGYDFSQVRVHTDSQAAGMAQSVRAFAFTVGHDVVFGTGQYQPETEAGQSLLAHEITHVVQQTGGSSTGSLSPSPSTEQSTVQPQAGLAQQHSGVQLQRQPADEEKQIAAVEAAIRSDLQKGAAFHAQAYARLGTLAGGRLDPEIVDAVREQGDAVKETLDLLSASVSMLAALPEARRRIALGAGAIELQQFATNTDHLLILSRVVNVNVPDVFDNKDEADDRLADIAEWHEEWIDANIDVGDFAGDWVGVQLEIEEQIEVSGQVAENFGEQQSRLQQQAKALSDITNWVDGLEAEIQSKKTGAKILRFLEKVDEVLSYIPGRRGRGGRRARRPRRTRRTKTSRAKATKDRRQKRADKKKKRKENKAEKIRRGIRRLLKSPLFRRGPFAQAGGSIIASNPDSVPAADQRAVNGFGRQFGDHHTGARRPGTKSGNWVGDHMPVTELVRTAQRDAELRTMMTAERLPTNLTNQRLYPHSLRTARIQGGTVRGIQLKLEALARAKARR